MSVPACRQGAVKAFSRMKTQKRKRLEHAGWRLGSAGEFLGLNEVELAVVEIKLALATKLKKVRLRSKLTQTQLAVMMESSQSRVAKMEAGDATVSLELLVEALLAAGASRREIASALARSGE